MLCVEYPAGRSLVCKLQWEVFARANGVFDVKSRKVNVIADAAVRYDVGDAGVQNLCNFNVLIDINRGV